MNLTDPIWRACEAWPEHVAVHVGDRSLRYSELATLAGTVAQRLALAGVEPADVVALALSQPLIELLVTLGAVRIGATVTPHKPNWAAALKKELFGRHATRWLIGDARQPDPVAQSMGVRCLDSSALLAPAGSGAAQAGRPPVVRGLDAVPWRLSLSSGTTGTPKSIPQSHVLGALVLSLVAAMAGEANQRLMVYADLAIGVAAAEGLAQLAGGGELVLLPSPGAPQVLAALRQRQPTRLVTTTGNAGGLVEHAHRICPEGVGGGGSLRSVLIAGSAVAPALRQGVARHLCEHIEVAYGSTEAGRLAVLNPAAHALRPGSAGRLLPWVQARAFDESGEALPVGRVGLLGFRAPTVFDGYLGDAVTTAAVLRDGWFFPGDRGSVDEAGFLSLHGRVDDVLNLGGLKLDPTRIEGVLDRHPGVRESAVLALDAPGGQTVLVAVLVVDGPFDEAALRQRCRAQLGPSMVPRLFTAVEALPRNDAGKIMRRALVARWSIGPAPAAAPQETRPQAPQQE